LLLNLFALPLALASADPRLPQLPAPPLGQLSEARESETVQRIYPLGSISRISGRLRMDPAIEVGGRLTALTWARPAGPYLGVVSGRARLDLLARGARRL